MFTKIRIALCFIIATIGISVTAMAGMITETEENDTMSRATLLPLNTDLQGKITWFDTKNDEDWFKFTITENGYDYFNFFPARDQDLDDIRDGWKVYLMDENLDVLLSWSDLTSTVRWKMALTKGNYYIRVCADDPSIKYYPRINYQIRIDFIRDESWITDDESNSTFKNIEVNNVYRGLMYNPYDSDTFVCSSVSSPATVVFKIDENAVQSNIRDGWHIVVYDGERNKLVEKWDVRTDLSIPELQCKKGLRIIVNSDDKSYKYYPKDCEYTIQVIGGKSKITPTPTPTPTPIPEVHVSSVQVNKKSVILKKGNKYQIIPTVQPANAANKKVKYTSTNKKVATVNAKGMIKAKRKGTCKIIVESVDGRKRATVKVVVKK